MHAYIEMWLFSRVVAWRQHSFIIFHSKRAHLCTPITNTNNTFTSLSTLSASTISLINLYYMYVCEFFVYNCISHTQLLYVLRSIFRAAYLFLCGFFFHYLPFACLCGFVGARVFFLRICTARSRRILLTN